jgi:hypothetical protein
MSFCLYSFFNNSTVAAIIAVLVAAIFARWQYRQQKDIDRTNERKKEVIDNLVLLKEKIKYVLLILDRMVNTRKLISSKESVKDFLDALAKYEVPRLSNTLNEDIPLLDMKITNLLDLYFQQKSEIHTDHDQYKAALKKWHDYIINAIPGEKFNFNTKTSEIPELSTVDIEENIKKLIKSISIS